MSRETHTRRCANCRATSARGRPEPRKRTGKRKGGASARRTKNSADKASRTNDVAGEKKQKQEKEKVLFRRARPWEDETCEDPLLLLSMMDGPPFTFP